MDHWVRDLGRHWPFGIPPWGQIGRYGKPLLARYPFSQVEIHFIHFCAAAKREVDQDPEKRKYWTLARFSEFFLTWAPPTRSAISLPYQRTADDCDQAAGIPVKEGPA